MKIKCRKCGNLIDNTRFCPICGNCIDNGDVNYLLIGMIESTIMILPITYKIFNLPFDNYKKYNINAV